MFRNQELTPTQDSQYQMNLIGFWNTRAQKCQVGVLLHKQSVKKLFMNVCGNHGITAWNDSA
ncbi:MAG: hypothetical protein EB039_10850 [Proteobacteria bacterium]|nr:hypothetical protein [Pseudomonadota bacterium]